MEKTGSSHAEIKELLDAGKAKGILTYKEIMDALEELELDQEQIEKIYEHLEEMNIDVVEEVEVPEDINEEIAEIESTLAAVEGVNIDDPIDIRIDRQGAAAHGGRGGGHCAAHGGGRPGGQAPAGRSEPASGRLHCQTLCRARDALLRPHSGGEPGPHQGG